MCKKLLLGSTFRSWAWTVIRISSLLLRLDEAWGWWAWICTSDTDSSEWHGAVFKISSWDKIVPSSVSSSLSTTSSSASSSSLLLRPHRPRLLLPLHRCLHHLLHPPLDQRVDTYCGIAIAVRLQLVLMYCDSSKWVPLRGYREVGWKIRLEERAMKESIIGGAGRRAKGA